jgi:hypothetical protein
MTEAPTLHYLWAAASTLEALAVEGDRMLRVAEYRDGGWPACGDMACHLWPSEPEVSARPMVVTEAPTLLYRWAATSTLNVLTVLRCVMRDDRLYGSVRAMGAVRGRPELGVEVSTEVQFQTPGAGYPRSEQREGIGI